MIIYTSKMMSDAEYHFLMFLLNQYTVSYDLSA